MARRRVITERIGTGVSLGASANWSSKVIAPGIIGCIQLWVDATATTGNFTMQLRGRAVAPGESPVANHSRLAERASLTTATLYYLATAPVFTNSTSGGQSAPDSDFAYISTSAASSITFDAWLVYEVEQ